MENQIEQKCSNCKFYIAHYIKRFSQLIEINGHCVNEEWEKINRRNNHRLHDNCPFWEHEISKIEERRESIEDTVRFMKSRLDEMLFILTDDKKRIEK